MGLGLCFSRKRQVACQRIVLFQPACKQSPRLELCAGQMVLSTRGSGFYYIMTNHPDLHKFYRRESNKPLAPEEARGPAVFYTPQLHTSNIVVSEGAGLRGTFCRPPSILPFRKC